MGHPESRYFLHRFPTSRCFKKITMHFCIENNHLQGVGKAVCGEKVQQVSRKPPTSKQPPTADQKAKASIPWRLQLALFRQLLSILKNIFFLMVVVNFSSSSSRQPIFRNFPKYPFAIELSAVTFTPMTPLGVAPPYRLSATPFTGHYS